MLKKKRRKSVQKGTPELEHVPKMRCTVKPVL